MPWTRDFSLYFLLFLGFLALYSLEEHWTDLVSNAASLNERIRNQQDAIWELIETEVHYIRTLKVIQDVSICSYRLVLTNYTFPTTQNTQNATPPSSNSSL